jgi:hypothetical protein
MGRIDIKHTEEAEIISIKPDRFQDFLSWAFIATVPCLIIGANYRNGWPSGRAVIGGMILLSALWPILLAGVLPIWNSLATEQVILRPGEMELQKMFFRLGEKNVFIFPGLSPLRYELHSNKYERSTVRVEHSKGSGRFSRVRQGSRRMRREAGY